MQRTIRLGRRNGRAACVAYAAVFSGWGLSYLPRPDANFPGSTKIAGPISPISKKLRFDPNFQKLRFDPNLLAADGGLETQVVAVERDLAGPVEDAGQL